MIFDHVLMLNEQEQKIERFFKFHINPAKSRSIHVGAFTSRYQNFFHLKNLCH